MLTQKQRTSASTQSIIDSLVSRYGMDESNAWVRGLLANYQAGGAWPMDWYETFVDSSRPWGF